MTKSSATELMHPGISANEALMNFARVLVGTGVLALPLAFKEGGSLIAIAIVVWGGFFFTYMAGEKLVASAVYLSERHGITTIDYGGVAESAFKFSLPSWRKYGSIARTFTNTAIISMQLGASAVYMVFIKEHLQEIAARLLPGNEISDASFLFISVFCLCLIVMIRDLRFISRVSAVGNVIMVIIMLMVFQDLVRPPYASGQILVTTSAGAIISASGNIIYAFCCQAIVLPLANKMRQPRQMLGSRGVLSIGCSVVTILYGLIGFFGYLKYGDAVRGAITLNLPDTTFYFYIRVFLVLSVFTTFLIQHFIVIDMSWPWIQKKFSGDTLVTRFPGTCERILCIIVVFAAFLLAVLVPNLGRITSLVGVTAGCLLGFTIPACIHAATFLPEILEKQDFFHFAQHVWSDVAFFICGIFFTVTGIYSNL